jgi:hypothetical protein
MVSGRHGTVVGRCAPVIVGRIVLRSYQRWRSNELLWGTNRERFFPQFKVWDEKSSLIAWAVRHHTDRRREYESAMKDERWRHIAFHRFRSNAEADRWTRMVTEGPVETEAGGEDGT